MIKRRKKYLAAITAVVASGTLLVTTALAASDNVSGFEQIKQAALNLNTMGNGTVEYGVELLENGEALFSTKFTSKVEDEKNSSSKFSIQMGSDSITSIENLKQDGKCFLKTDDNDTYYTEERVDTTHKFTEKEARLLSLFMDMVAGDTKNYFNSENGTISLQLKGNQIPELAQLVLSVASENGSFAFYDTFPGDPNANKVDLVADALVEDITFDATIDDNGFFEQIDSSMVISGTDSNGIYRNYVAQFALHVSDIDTTVIEKVDMTGKTVTEINQDTMRRFMPEGHGKLETN